MIFRILDSKRRWLINSVWRCDEPGGKCFCLKGVYKHHQSIMASLYIIDKEVLSDCWDDN